MRRLLWVFLGGSAVCFSANARDNFHTVETENYVVHSEVSEGNAAYGAYLMESLYDLYQPLLARHLDGQKDEKREIFLFESRASFQVVVREEFGIDRETFVYVDTPKKRGLYAFWGEEGFLRELAHQGAIQYIRMVDDQAPLWFIEGAALYFETVEQTEGVVALQQPHNDAVKEALVALGKERPTIGEILSAKEEEIRKSPERFLPAAWGLFSFVVSRRGKQPSRFERLQERQEEFDRYVRSL